MSNNVDPSIEQFNAFKDLPRDTPIMMLNLIRLRDVALYADGQTDGQKVSGAEAYKRYGQGSAPIFTGLGGEIIWRGKPENVLIGPSEEQWDIAFIARYPNSGAFLAMVKNEDYQKVVIHRQAAVLDSRLIRMGEEQEGSGFSG